MITKALTATILLSLLIFSGCDSGGMFFAQGLNQDIPVRSVDDGSSLGPDQEVPISVQADSMNSPVDLVVVELRDSLGRLVADTSYEGEQLTFPDLPPLLLKNLQQDIYLLHIELFNNGESLGSKENWFYYTDDSISLRQITVNPHSAAPGEAVTVGIELDSHESKNPYIQLRQNGVVVYEGDIEGDSLQFQLTAPSDPGIYDLRLDIYPWYDSRISADVYSENTSTLELLVTSADDADVANETRIDPQPGLSIGEDLMYYSGDRISTRLMLDADSRLSLLNGKLFDLSNGDFDFGLSVIDGNLDLRIQRADSYYLFPAELQGEDRSVSIDLLQGETHFTVLITSGDRLAAGEVIPYTSFIPDDAAGNEDIPGLSVSSSSLSALSLRSIESSDELESLFKLILQKKYGNFVLYADGFEFASAVSSAISYSDDAYIQNGYLVLPPGAWVELPDFALDEYSVEIESIFHPQDDLSMSSIVLLQEAGEDYKQVFTIEGADILKAGGQTLVSGLGLTNDISFTLNRSGSSIDLKLSGEEYFLPAETEGRFRLLISQDTAAEIRIRLDSASAANAPEEFVDRVLDSLP